MSKWSLFSVYICKCNKPQILRDSNAHRLVTQDKWEITDRRGRIQLSSSGVTSLGTPRNVYNISGQQGEYCIVGSISPSSTDEAKSLEFRDPDTLTNFEKNNDLIRAALQPALALVSKILWSDHPTTWVWANIYRMHPVLDGRRADDERRTEDILPDHLAAGITEQEWFAIWLGKINESKWYPEQEALHSAGFSSRKYVLQILKRTIQWQINAKHLLDETEDDMGFTQVIPATDPNLPFTIRVSISADYIWPLLVKDYSEAEKACCSFVLAAIMLHELSVSQFESSLL